MRPRFEPSSRYLPRRTSSPDTQTGGHPRPFGRDVVTRARERSSNRTRPSLGSVTATLTVARPNETSPSCSSGVVAVAPEASTTAGSDVSAQRSPTHAYTVRSSPAPSTASAGRWTMIPSGAHPISVHPPLRHPAEASTVTLTTRSASDRNPRAPTRSRTQQRKRFPVVIGRIVPQARRQAAPSTRSRERRSCYPRKAIVQSIDAATRHDPFGGLTGDT